MPDIYTSLRAAGFSDIRDKRSGKSWSVIGVAYSTGLQRMLSDIVFFNSSARWDAVAEAARALRVSAPTGDFYPVVQNSAKPLCDDLWRVSKELGTRNAAKTVRSLLFSTLTRNAGVESVEVEVLEESRFVEPTLRRSGGREGEALTTLASWVESLDSLAEPHLGVVLAEGGIGKTTLMRQLYARLMKQKGPKASIPLLVESHHWAKFAATSSDLDLTDIWKNSFDSLYSAIITGELLEECIHRGAMTVVFDGFDELCTKLSTQFRPGTTLEKIRDLLTENEGKVLITSRRAFWDDFVEPAVKKEFEVFELLPFNRQQTEKYWTKSFMRPEDSSKRDRARTIHARIETLASSPFREQLGAVPAVLAMIAECADEDEPGEKYGKYLNSERPLDGLIRYMCAREQVRRLPSAEPEAQVKWLTDLALDFGDNFSVDDLKLYAEIDLALSLPELTAISSHSLVRRSTAENSSLYTFRFDFLGDYLSARWMAAELPAQADAPTSKAMTLLARNASGSSEFVDYLARELNVSQGFKDLPMMFSKLHGAEGTQSEEAASCVFHLALRCVDRVTASGPRAERTARLLELLGFPKAEIKSFSVRGSIAGLDFTGIVFSDCVFRDVTFSNCTFDTSTCFRACKFEGRLEVDNLNSFGTVLLDDRCQYSSSAWETIQLAVGSKRIPVTESVILDAFHTALNKFKLGLGFKSLTAINLKTGPIGKSPFRQDIWEALEKSGIIEYHLITSVGPRGGVNIAKSSMPEVQRFLDNRLIVGRIASAIGEVKRKVLGS